MAGLLLRRPRLATGCNGGPVLGGLVRVITRRSVWRRGVAAARPPGSGSGQPGVEGAFRCNGSEGVFGNLREHDSQGRSEVAAYARPRPIDELRRATAAWVLTDGCSFDVPVRLIRAEVEFDEAPKAVSVYLIAGAGGSAELENRPV